MTQSGTSKSRPPAKVRVQVVYLGGDLRKPGMHGEGKEGQKGVSAGDYTVSDYRLCLDIVPLRGKETGVQAPALGMPPPLARKGPGEQVAPGVGQGH